MTQGAVSQTVKPMESEGLVWREPSEDGRSAKVALTEEGRARRRILVEQWTLRLDAIAELEREIDAPLRQVLARAIDALERDGFDARIARRYG